MKTKPSLWRKLLGPLGAARRLVRADGGSVSVEWALVAPIFVLLLVGVMEFSSGALHKMQMANAVRAGLQYATVRKPIQGDTTQIRDAVAATAPEDKTGTRMITVTMFCLCPDGSAVDCTGTCSGGDRSSFVSIGMSEEFEPIMSLPFSPARHNYTTTGVIQLN